MKLGLGIDTGGTFTDAVVVRMDTGETVCRAKSPTTHEDLSSGIAASIGGLDRDVLKDICLVSLSSTLATNSVVEDRGGRVGLICIGKDAEDPEDYSACYARVEGSFDMSGNETKPLDIECARSVLESMEGKVDAVAVSGYLSVRNPGHEDTVRRMTKEILGVPAVCGHDLSSKLGFSQRVSTAAMDAGLIPVIAELIAAVKSSLKEAGIDAPLMIVKGDGSIMGEGYAAERAVETILSGPASSLMGAKTLTGLEDALVVDMGGTTSDIGMLRNGIPRMMDEGAMISGHRTRVRAADMITYGIGGDSRIIVNGKDLVLTSVRVVPICVAAERHPHILDRLRSLSGITDDRSAEAFPVQDVCQDTEFFVSAGHADTGSLRECDASLLELLKDGPLSLSEASDMLGLPVHAFSVSEMETTGTICRIGVTPTDLLCAEGTFTEHDPEASRLAVEYLARKSGLSTGRFISKAKEEVVRRIASCVMDYVFRTGSGNDTLSDAHSAIISECLSDRAGCYSLAFSLNMPMVGIGAPAGAWLPAVAELLGTHLALPDGAEYGNALGAIAGSVSESASVTVRADQGDRSADPGCFVFAPDGRKKFDDSTSAVSYAEKVSAKEAERMAKEAGAYDVIVETKVEKEFSDVSGDGNGTFRGATVTSVATGRPRTLER